MGGTARCNFSRVTPFLTDLVGSSRRLGRGTVLFTTWVLGCGPAGTGSSGEWGANGTDPSESNSATASESNTTPGDDSNGVTVSESNSATASESNTAPGDDSVSSGPGSASASATDSDGTSGASDASASADGSLKYDIGGPEPEPGDPRVPGDVICAGEGSSDCTQKAPPNSFDPVIQWVYDVLGERESMVTPMVANLTDDNGDGRIDVCTDIPDLVVVATVDQNTPGHIYVLDGATGFLHFRTVHPVDPTVNPALGDIDDDGLVEIVTSGPDAVAAFENDGTLKWVSSTVWAADEYISAVALADLDNDGDVEIIAGAAVYDHTGQHLWTAASGYLDLSASLLPATVNATAAADLDGDGDLEVVLGHSAYHHDGSEYYRAQGIGNGFPQIANLDDDPHPEVLITNMAGITMLEHDGQVKYKDLTPTGVPGIGTSWIRPATVHDFDGNGVAEFASSSATNYTVYNGDATIVWSAFVNDGSGIAAGTAFDFLGDSKAEAMYADESTFYIYNDQGMPYLAVPRSSQTAIEYPTVADLDNDGSAEIAVVSMIGQGTPQTAPTVQVIRDKDDRWIQARRIWNQHTYHVTNVLEDGRIPQFEHPSWKGLNTFRTQAQIHAGGGTCQPPPAE